MGIAGQAPQPPASPWQNGFAERLIGSTARVFGYVIVLGEEHMSRILKILPTRYYNASESIGFFFFFCLLNKDATVFGLSDDSAS